MAEHTNFRRKKSRFPRLGLLKKLITQVRVRVNIILKIRVIFKVKGRIIQKFFKVRVNTILKVRLKKIFKKFSKLKKM